IASDRAATLSQDVQILHDLVNQQLIPSEVRSSLQQAVAAIDHLGGLLPRDSAKAILEPVSAEVDFYALALLRDGELFKHTMELRQMDHQATTVLVVGGFHTPGLTQRLKSQGLSYWVITPNIKRHTSVDERLYVERMLGRHLSLEQISDGQDWASMGLA